MKQEHSRGIGRLRVLALAGVLMLAVLVAGCGGSSDSNGTSTIGSAGSKSAVSAAIAATKAHSATPTDVGIAGPLTKRPASGQKIDFLACALPTCQEQARYFKNAASNLNWTVKVVNFKLSPEALQAGFETAIADKPSGVVVSGFPSVIYKKQLAQLDKMGVPVVDYATTNQAKDGIIAVAGNDTVNKYGSYEAEWIAADSGGKAKVVMFNTPDYPVQVKLEAALKKRLLQLCPSCTFKHVDVALTDIGPGLPNKIVSELQREPDTNYLVTGFADLNAGVPAALKNAGLNKVKLVTAGPGQAAYQDIMDGNLAMASAQPKEEQQWCLVDALARHSVGDQVPANACNLPSQIMTSQNVTKAWTDWPGVPGWKAAFLKAWKVA